MPAVVALPVPSGWYAVAFSDDLRPGNVLARMLGEHELVIFRTRSGVVTAMDAYCPHLGAPVLSVASDHRFRGRCCIASATCHAPIKRG